MDESHFVDVTTFMGKPVFQRSLIPMLGLDSRAGGERAAHRGR